MDALAMRTLLNELSSDVRAFGGARVERLSSPPTGLEFLRRFVAPSRPCVVAGALSDWPASRWTLGSLREQLGDAEVSVTATPDGRADAVAVVGGRRVFALPEERRVPFGALCDALCAAPRLVPPSTACDGVVLGGGASGASGDGTAARGPAPRPAAAAAATREVLYCSAQNDSLRTDFAAVAGDVPRSLPWAEAAFGAPPEATNLWLGDGRSATSLHADPYENVYALLFGEKRFLLRPPEDGHLLGVEPLPVVRWARRRGAGGGGGGPAGWAAEPEAGAGAVRWARDPCDEPGPAAAAPPSPPSSACVPPPAEVVLRPGEVLYIPAFWWHRVEQRGVTLAVNFWHEAALDGRAAARAMVDALAARAAQPG